jgi:hypothetical protein
MMKSIAFALLTGLFSFVCVPAPAYSSNNQAPTIQSLVNMPMAFTKNMGQWPDSILFRADAGGATMWFVRNGIYYQYSRRIERTREAAASANESTPQISTLHEKFAHERDSIETMLIKAEYVGANPNVEVVGLEEVDYKCNYFIGNQPANWHTDVPNYSAVTLGNIYPGVTATLRGKKGGLEYQLIGKSADLARVNVEYRGAQSSSMQHDGTTMLATEFGEWRFRGILPVSDTAPVEQTSTSSSSSDGLALIYSTYLGGSSGENVGYFYKAGIAVDAAGSAYITGTTNSADFPVQSAFQTSIRGRYDVFVTKLTSSGNGLIYSTYLGGTHWPEPDYDEGLGIAVDAGGSAYITGMTTSMDFPTLNAFQTYPRGNGEAFVVKLNSTGNGLVYSTYLGGMQTDESDGIAVDAGGNAYITGRTISSDFPIQNAFQSALRSGDYDVFVTKLNAAGNGLVYSTYLGGASADWARGGIAVDAGGNVYIAGYTESPDFPIQNAFQSALHGFNDAFVTKLNAAGNGLVYSTYLGGGGSDWSPYWSIYEVAIAVDTGGNAYITGSTESADFPTQNAFQSSLRGNEDAFVTKLNAAGNGLVYSTYLGGMGEDGGSSIAVDAGGNAHVTGYTTSDAFPTQNALQSSLRGDGDAFVTKLNAAGNGLVYSTYLGCRCRRKHLRHRFYHFK